MTAYEAWKIIHLISVFLFVSSLAVNMLAPERIKATRIAFPIAGLTAMVAGIALMLQLGLKHELWVMTKFFIWLAIFAAAGIVTKRFPERKAMAFWALFGLVVVALIMVVLKPV